MESSARTTADSLNTVVKNIGIYTVFQQESPAVADKPARRESMPNIAPIRRADNVVADNTGRSSFV